MRTSLAHDISMDELNYLRSQGLNNKQIAEKLDCSIATVGKYLPSQRKPRVQLSDADKKDIVELYEQGSSAAEIAEAYNCAVTTIYRLLKDKVPEKKALEPKYPDIIETAVDLDAQKQHGSLTTYMIGVYDGRLGTYHVNLTNHTVDLPEVQKTFSKEDLGYYIRDLMTIWKEM